MMTPMDAISQLDIMAYADGQLDPVRRREVEMRLARSPELLETAQAIALQNESIQEAYAAVLAEPVPEHLASTLDAAGPARRMARLRRVAAVLVTALATGLGGWWIGRSLEPSKPDDVTSFVEAVADAVLRAAELSPVRASTWPNVTQPLEWLANRVTLELRPPDLAARGYRLIGKALVEVDGQPTVRLTYQRDDGNTVSLYMRTRWRETAPTVNLETTEATAAAYWFDGPMMWVLTGDLAEDELGTLAETIHGTTRLKPSSAEPGPARNALDLDSPAAMPVQLPQ